MSAETKKVLEMLAAGKISTDDAERLLEKLSGGTAQANAANSQAASDANPGTGGTIPHTRRPRFLHIKVQRPDGRDTDVRVPLGAVRCGRHWTAFLPLRVAEKLFEYGIDFGSLEAMSEPEFQAAMDRMNIHIQSQNGKNVQIYAE
jgi:hypothetical protein